MTKLTLSVLALVFSTSTVFAQDYLNCGLKISDNKIDCPFFGGCPQKELKESKSQLFLEVNEGDLLTGKIEFKKVLLFPGTKKEKDNKVVLFKDDSRLEKVKGNKKVELAAYDLKTGIDYSVQKNADTLNISFKTPVYVLNIELSGNGKYQDYVLTSHNAVSVVCEKLNKEVYEEFKARKEAIEVFKKEKAKSSSASQQ